MEIVWSRAKNHWLRARRNLSFDDGVPILLEKRYLAVLENPARADQMIFLIRYRDYTYVVPFEIDGDRIVLKTVFPSRKFHKIYAGKDGETWA